MAFRKRFPKRRFFRTKNLARKRRTWAQLSIDPCAAVELPHCLPIDGCCTDIARLELLGNQQLQDLYSDRCSVVRILGDLWFAQNMGTVTGVADITAWLAYLNASQEFIGLRKGEITSQQPIPPSLDVWDTAFDDLSEGKWFKTWQRFSDAASNITFGQGANNSSAFSIFVPVATNDTHTFIVPGTTACNALAGGTGDICIETDTDIDCVECPQSITPDQIQWNTASATLIRPWHVHFDVKKKISMRENEVLYLNYNLRHYGGQPPFADSFSTIFGNVRTLIEMG